MILLSGNKGPSCFNFQRNTDKPRSWERHLVPFLVALLCLLGNGKSAADSIRVSWDPAQVRGGGVVLIKIQAPANLAGAEAVTGKNRFPLLRTAHGSFRAIVGIDQELEGSVLHVDFSFYPVKGGSPYRIGANLKIPKQTSLPEKEQKLSLPTGMVDLSQKRLSQVKKDNRSLGDVLELISRHRYWNRAFILPVKGRITTKFGEKRILNGKFHSSHHGVDIAARIGTGVKAANGGVVQLADDFFLSGKTVVINHGWGVSTIYAHLDKFLVSEGQFVARGQLIGRVGKTGRVTGPHLHFGAYIRGTRVDPLRLINATKNIQVVKPLRNPEGNPGS